MQTNGNNPPSPPHATNKECYQGRMGVKPTTTAQLAFNNSAENGERALYQGTVMDYTSINGKSPTAQERGMSPIKAKGYYDNSKA